MSREREGRHPDGSVVDGRYRVLSQLGRGGSSEVYAVLDGSSETELALKSFVPRGRVETDHLAESLFEREYCALAELAHPRIIQVFDYGVAEGAPYYTMELLSGQDLRSLSPLPWQRACAHLRDVASSLALIHSRKMVHRDVTPRNVLVTGEGRAKLVDFGALTTMGVATHVVGTPPFVPPEAVYGEPLDGRADLYALGATAYWVLTGRHAYPAARVDELPERWASPPPPPSAFEPAVPRELDGLVLALLAQSPRSRPAHAMEVSERLAAIADLPAEDDTLRVRGAYLEVPTYVGQARARATARRLLSGLAGGGGALFVEGKPGTGRSRFLSVLSLDAQMAHALTARAEPAGGAPYAALRPLVRDLLARADAVVRAALPPGADVLRAVFNELAVGPSGDAKDSLPARPERAAILVALRDWLLAVSRARPLLLVVDDVHLVDEPSAAVLASLARKTAGAPILVAASAPSGLPLGPAQRSLRSASEVVTLGVLGKHEIRSLVESVFGAVPNVSAVAEHLFTRSQGNPGACLTFVRHLVSQDVARFERGAWWLPERIDWRSLPSTVNDALAERASRLSPEARALALGLALVDGPLPLEDHEELLPDCSAPRRFRALRELVLAELLDGHGETYKPATAELSPLLVQAAEPGLLRTMHARIAGAEARRGDRPMHAVHHLLEAGSDAAALDLLVATLERLEAGEIRFSTDWLAHFQANVERALPLAESLGRPRRDAFRLRFALVLLSYLVDPLLASVHGPAVEQQLRHDLGVDSLGDLAHLPEAERVQARLSHARGVFDATAERERVLSPEAALLTLSHYAGLVTSPMTLMLDFEGLERVISLVEPFVSLGPQLRLSCLLLRAGEALDRCQSDRAEAYYREALALIESSRSELRHRTMLRCGVLFGLAHACAFHARSEILGWASELDRHPLQQVNAWRVRRFYHLFTGDTAHAELCAREVESRSLENEALRTAEGGTVFNDMLAAAQGGDLLQFGNVLERITEMARRYPNQVPTLHYAMATYERLRGNLPAARERFALALSKVTPGRHTVWPSIVEGYVETLLGVGEKAAAHALARDAFELATKADLAWNIRVLLEAGLGLAEAEIGEHEAARARLSRGVAEAEERSLAPVLLARLYERAAWAALLRGDGAAGETFAGKFDALARGTENPVLLARSSSLSAQNRRRVAPSQAPEMHSLAELMVATDFHTLMSTPGTPAERARRALALLTSHAGAAGGYLYRLHGGELSLVAASLDEPPSHEARLRMGDYLETFTDPEDIETATLATVRQPLCPLASTGSEPLVPVLLARKRLGRFEVNGLAALRLPGTSACHVPAEIMDLVCELLDPSAPSFAAAIDPR